MTAPFTPAVQSLPVFEYFRICNDPIAAQALPPAPRIRVSIRSVADKLRPEDDLIISLSQLTEQFPQLEAATEWVSDGDFRAFSLWVGEHYYQITRWM